MERRHLPPEAVEPDLAGRNVEVRAPERVAAFESRNRREADA